MAPPVTRVRQFRVSPQSSLTTENLNLHTSRCVKYTMFFKNMFFLICGVLLGAIGFIALKEKNKLNGQFDNLFLDPAAVLLTVGVIIVVISFCGALGALRENKYLLRFFYISIIIILILEIALAIAVYAWRGKIRHKVDEIFQGMIVEYHEDRDLQFVVDYVQKEVGCCGSMGCDDWKKNPYYNCTDKAIVSACSVPYSCCKADEINRMCGGGVLKLDREDRDKKVYTVGCLEALEDWLMARLKYAGIACGCLVVLQLVAVHLAFRMISDINEIIKWRESH